MSTRSLNQFGAAPTATINLNPSAAEDGQALCYDNATGTYSPDNPIVATGGAKNFAATWTPSAGAVVFQANTPFKVTTVPLAAGRELVFCTWNSTPSTTNADAVALATVQLTLPNNLLPATSGDPAGSATLVQAITTGCSVTVTCTPATAGTGRLVITPNTNGGFTPAAAAMTVSGGSAMWVAAPVPDPS